MIVVAVAGDVVDVFVAVVVVATESQQHLEPRDRKLP